MKLAYTDDEIKEMFRDCANPVQQTYICRELCDCLLRDMLAKVVELKLLTSTEHIKRVMRRIMREEAAAEAIRAKQAEYYEKHRDARIEYGRKWRNRQSEDA